MSPGRGQYLTKKHEALLRRPHRVVAVPAQLDEDAARIPDVVERPQHRRKVDLAVAEREMIVDALTHVFDVHVAEDVLPAMYLLRDRRLPLTMEMADVERQ